MHVVEVLSLCIVVVWQAWCCPNWCACDCVLLCGRHGAVLAAVHVVEVLSLCIVVVWEAWCCPNWCACGRGMVLS